MSDFADGSRELRELLGVKGARIAEMTPVLDPGTVPAGFTGDRAVSYRRIDAIPDEWGTALNVQQMVYDNHGETSGSGVAFGRTS